MEQTKQGIKQYKNPRYCRVARRMIRIAGGSGNKIIQIKQDKTKTILVDEPPIIVLPDHHSNNKQNSKNHSKYDVEILVD